MLFPRIDPVAAGTAVANTYLPVDASEGVVTGVFRRSSGVGLAFVALVSAARVVRAQEPACADAVNAKSLATAVPLINDGNRALKEGRLDEAIRLLQSAFCAYPLPALQHNISEAALGLNDCEEALSAGKKWVDLSRGDETVDAQKWSSTLLGLCGRAKVLVDPQAAEVRIDGKTTALKGSRWDGWLHVGDHTVTAHAEAFEDQSVKLTVQPGAVASVTLSLVPKQLPLCRQVTVTVEPRWADVLVDGSAVTTSGDRWVGCLKLGEEHRVLARKRGFDDQEQIFSLPQGPPMTIGLRLPAACAPVTVSVQPPADTISVDDLATTAAAQWSGCLAEGTHRLLVRKTGFDDDSREISIAAGSRTASSVTVHLVAHPAPPAIVPPLPPPVEPPPAPVVVAPAAPVLPTPLPAPPIQVSAVRRQAIWEPIVPAGIAAIGLAVGIAGAVINAQCPTAVDTPPALYNAGVCQYNSAVLADIGWAVTGAAAAATLATGLALGLSARRNHAETVAIAFSGNGLSVAGRF